MPTVTCALQPHPDIEHGIERQPFEAVISLPDALPERPQLVFTIPGYGKMASEPYFRDKLNPYLAEKYGVVAVSLNYHGIDRLARELRFRDLGSFLVSANRLYGYVPQSNDVSAILGGFAAHLKALGVQAAPLDFKHHLVKEFHEYHSFGLLPALDHLYAVAQLEATIGCRFSQIDMLGTSYGGFIANLASKLAPHVFDAVIDNSGFARCRYQDMLVNDLSGHTLTVEIEGLTFPVSVNYPWSLDEMSPHYLSDARRTIRNLLIPGHWLPGTSRHYLFHSSEDQRVAPVTDKDHLAALLAGPRQVVYRRVTLADIDGHCFKTLAHGMEASLRGLYDLAVAQACKPADPAIPPAGTRTYRFPCGFEDYVLTYDGRHLVETKIEAASQSAASAA